MARYLLDTNILSDAVWNPLGRIERQIERVGEDEVCTSIIVAAELRYGVAKRGARHLALRVSELLDRIEISPLDAPADRIYGELRVRLGRAGRPIGPNDLLIAAHALALGCVLVTDNDREFSRIGELPIENWLRG